MTGHDTTTTPAAPVDDRDDHDGDGGAPGRPGVPEGDVLVDDGPGVDLAPGAPPAARPGDGDGSAPGDDDLGDEDDDADPVLARRRRLIRLTVDLAVLAVCMAFVVWQLHPALLVRDTTPAGGDMGAHVWGPAYLRDQLLPHLQVAGWTPDWYAGFPAYQFYMVVPSLVIVLLNAGLQGWAALVPLAAAAGFAAVAVGRRHERRVRRLAIAGAVVALCLVGLPYGVAFKLVTVSGLVALPPSAYALGRLSGLRFPTPAVFAVATLPYLFYRGYTIYGGNIASTLAGEFAFSMALSLGLLYLGVVIRGLETGRHRALAALLLALCGLCHLIVALWALGATAIAVFVRFRRSTAPVVPCAALAAAGACFGVALLLGQPTGPAKLVLAALAVAGLGAGLWLLSDSVRWLTPVLVVGGLLTAFWVLPFYLRSDYVNDMGWEKLPYPDQTIWQHLFPSKTPDVDLRWVFALAMVGAGISLALRLRAGLFLLAATVSVGVAFVVMPEGRLWNGRLLPFYFLTAMLLAALAVSESARLVAQIVRNGRREPVAVGVATAVGALVVTLVVVGLPLGALPFGERAGAGWDWPRFGPLRAHAEPESFVPSWARWNYTGYELKDSYREYHDVVETMRDVGEQEGCGRAFWEYEKELDRYGTPMALMLLPFWTDGCIGSMEGLYFEASATTPYHFLTQVELSTNPSAAQRDLPYGAFDIDRGVAHLQMLGVRYYMATSDQAVAAARQQPELTEIASSGPWVVFEVADSDVVQPLAYEPAILDGVAGDQQSWLERPLDVNGRFGGPAVRWYTDPTQWQVPLSLGGLDSWQHVRVGERPEARPVAPATVSDVEMGREGLSFDVDQVGTPVLVKVSYFPNWEASGAEGPYRVTPNLMVVVPTSDHVELTYGRTPVEYVAYGLTLVGLAGLVLLARWPAHRFRGAGPRIDPAAR